MSRNPFSSVRGYLPLALLLLVTDSAAQTAPGFRMIGPHGTSETYLIDTAGEVVHTWPSGFNPGNGVYLESDGTLLRAVATGGGPGIGGAGGGVQRIAFDGTILWDYKYNTGGNFGHHDVEALPNGNVLIIAWEDFTPAEAIAQGRNPATIGSIFRPDHLVEVQQTGLTTGTIVWEWHIWDHLIQDFDNSKANFGVVANHPELIDINYPPGTPNQGDWNHANAIDYDPAHDWIVFSANLQDEIWIIDHSTTTAEAAGHSGGTHGKGGDLLYRWGNIAAYDKGTASDQLLHNQHGPNFVAPGLPGAGNLMIFNNQVGGNFSAVYELALPVNGSGGFDLLPDGTYGPAGPFWEYTAQTATDFFSPFLSNAERLPNGNTLIDSGVQSGWLFEVTDAGTKVWEHFNTLPSSNAFVFQVSYVERSLWSSDATVSAAAGATIDFDLVAGTPRAGDFYFLLGSISGTSPGIPVDGFTLPLNNDPYFKFTLNFPGSALFSNSFGVVDAQGRGTASMNVAPGLAVPLVGVTMNHAYGLVDSTTFVTTHTSNAVPLVIMP